MIRVDKRDRTKGLEKYGTNIHEVRRLSVTRNEFDSIMTEGAEETHGAEEINEGFIPIIGQEEVRRKVDAESEVREHLDRLMNLSFEDIEDQESAVEEALSIAKDIDVPDGDEDLSAYRDSVIAYLQGEKEALSEAEHRAGAKRVKFIDKKGHVKKKWSGGVMSAGEKMKGKKSRKKRRSKTRAYKAKTKTKSAMRKKRASRKRKAMGLEHKELMDRIDSIMQEVKSSPYDDIVDLISESYSLLDYLHDSDTLRTRFDEDIERLDGILTESTSEDDFMEIVGPSIKVISECVKALGK